MKLALLSAALLALASSGSSASVVDSAGYKLNLGYEPTINKKIVKRIKRKAERRRNAPAAEVKRHNQRNKKGRP